VEYVCEQCGQSFEAPASQKRRFCSRACGFANPEHCAKPKKERPERVCPGCGITFKQEGYLRRGKYCSRTCSGRIAIKSAYSDPKSNNKHDPSKWVTVACVTCHKPFKKVQSSKDSHCSRQCSDADPNVRMARVIGRMNKGSYDAKATYSRAKRGERRGVFFRSRMEANYAAYLDYCDTKWQYEARTFWFPQGSVCLSYRPDFYLMDEDRFVETKGFLDARSVAKFELMALYYPDIKLEVVGSDEYEAIKKLAAVIKGWEYDKH